MDAWGGKMSTPRLGVLDFRPIPYHTPLYRWLATRGNVELDVLYLNDLGFALPSTQASEYPSPETST